MRKFILLFLSIICVLCLAFSLTACGNLEQENKQDSEQETEQKPEQEATQGLTYELSEDKESYAVVGIGSYGGNRLVIPSEYKGKPVTAIGQAAFYDCKKLTSVTIPESITTIGNKAFDGCFIKKITVPSFSLTYIPKDTLESVTITSGKDIPPSTFKDCISLKSVTLPDSVTTIGDDAFYGCVGLTSITIPNSVTSIGDSAFELCYKLVEVYNLSSLNITKNSLDNGYVGYYALDVYTSLYAPSTLSTTKDGYILYESGNNFYLMGYKGTDTNLVLPDKFYNKNYAIYKYAFYKNSNIKGVTMPDSVTSIKGYAFNKCTSLISVKIGKSVTSIEDDAFSDCNNLQSVTFADTSNWTVINYYSERKDISVTDPSGNARYFKGDYGHCPWKKVA